MGLLRSQNAGSGGDPNVSPSTRDRIPFAALLAATAGISVISAALCALTARKSSGCRKAMCSAPYPPIEAPLTPPRARPPAPALPPPATDAIARFNTGKKLLHQEILIADFPAV